MTESRRGDAWEASARTLVAAMVAKPQPRPSETVLALLTYSMVPSWFVAQSTGSQAEILEKFRDRFREGGEEVMARDENNGEGTRDERYFFANTKEQFKKAHHDARVHGFPMFWFNRRRLYTSAGYGDRLNMWREYPLELRYHREGARV